MSEFTIGELVTYKPYDKEYPVKVAEIVPPNQTFNKCDEIRYHLTGAGREPVNAITTGRSIVESKLFEETKQEDWWK